MNTYRRKKKRGVSILEIMICLIILTGVIITFATVFPGGYRLNNANLKVNKAGNMAAAILDEVRRLPFADLGFRGGGQSTGLSVTSLTDSFGQNRWGAGGNASNDTNSPRAPKFRTANNLVFDFPRTNITIGNPVAADTGDKLELFLPLVNQGTFTVPGGQPGTLPPNTPAGIEVTLSGQDVATGLEALATLPDNTIVRRAYVRVTVGYRDTRGTRNIIRTVTAGTLISENATIP